ncbi:MAG: ABC transporter permease [Actinobacteria bacterium]|nr:ABC transporter permease [Actinomycetota bacterium]
MTHRAGIFRVLLVVTAIATFAFLLAPIAALLLQVPMRDLPGLLRETAVTSALLVSLKTNVIANVIILAVGTPAAYLLALGRFRGRPALLTLLELPLVLPPAVAGIALLTAFGAFGLFGSALTNAGIFLPFTQAAVVIAVTFVAGPYYVRAAVSAFAALDRNQLDAARDLGASEGTVFRRIALPLAADGLRAGWALAFARGIGEFGATLLFAGSVARVTETLPLAVYAQLDVNLDSAVAVGILLLAISGGVLLVAKLPPLWSPTGSSTPVGGW